MILGSGPLLILIMLLPISILPIIFVTTLIRNAMFR